MRRGLTACYVAADHLRAFDEAFYLLMVGAGVGFSVERQNITKLPDVAEDFHDNRHHHPRARLEIGWCKGHQATDRHAVRGQVPKYDLTSLRFDQRVPAQTFGGRAFRPQPLVDLFDHCITRSRTRQVAS